MNRWLLIPLVLGGLLAPLLLKGLYVDDFIFHYTNTRLLGFAQALANDAIVYAALICLLYLSYLPPVPRLLATMMRLCALILFLIYLIDYFVIVNFNTHLALGDAIKYTAYSYKYVQQIYGLNDIVLSAIGVTILAGISAFASSGYKLRDWRRRKLPLFLIAGLPLISGFTDNDRYAHAWIYRNVFDYNLTILSESAPYSDAFARNVQFDTINHCHTTAAERKNVIILMVESLSSYQSRFFSGIQDWTPNLDAIAAQHWAFDNFYANGFITEDGEIALLTGLAPIYPPSSYNDDGGVSFASFYHVETSLPKVLKAFGYRSEFLTSADLEFGNTGVWAHSIGFDYVEGHDHPDYNRWQRFHFQAAPDEALYLRALDRIKQSSQHPLLLFIKTVSTHHPYVNPENNHHSEAEAFQYADKQIGGFYRRLLADGFFDNGVLIIVGDHHSMTPLKAQEAERFGHYKASAKVPLLVVTGSSEPHRDSRQFQQTDVFNTLQGMATGQTCFDEWHGILWGEYSHAPRFIVHRRGDNRDKVSVFTDGDDYLVKLNGDATGVVGPRPEDPLVRQLVTDKINALRISRADWSRREKSSEKSD